MFGLSQLLTKYPLLHTGPSEYFVDSHFPRPAAGKLVPVFGVLLHFKFFGDFEKIYERKASEGCHWRGAIEYKTITNVSGIGKIEMFDGPVTKTFEDSQQLLRLGFFASPFED